MLFLAIELGQLPNLQSLSLRDAMFTGTIPSELGLLQVPVRIGIYNGLLTGKRVEVDAGIDQSYAAQIHYYSTETSS